MKEEYSKINYPNLKYFKKEMLKSDKFLSSYHELTNELFKNSETKDEGLQKKQELSLMLSIVQKKYNNYYIDSKNLSDFFIETKIKDETIKNINIMMKNKYDNFFTGRIFCKSLKRTIFFQFIQTVPYYNKTTCLTISATNGENVLTIPIESNDFGKEVYNHNIGKLILNMFFYMDAFPDKILNTPPDEVCDKLNMNNSKTISLSKDIADYLHENREVSPHLRRGHFKYLASNYFKNKKGQTIFVKSSFVKGQAKTIID